jgi:hypothetical protein
MLVNVRSGSKYEILVLSRCFPLCLQTQTLLDAVALRIWAITGPTRRLSKCEGKRSVFRTRQTDSLDDLIRPFEQLWRNRHTNCPSRLEIEYQYMLRQDLDRQVARFGAP